MFLKAFFIPEVVLSSQIRRIAARIALQDECSIIRVGDGADERPLEAIGMEMWDVVEAAEEILKRDNLMSRDEELLFAAVCGGEVVGGATLGRHEEEGQTVFFFSVGVDQTWQRKGLGRKLVEAVMGEVKSSGEQGYYRVWVVNPNMASLLESMGFETEGSEWSEDSPHMYFYPR